jgi:hypothetical protein
MQYGRTARRDDGEWEAREASIQVDTIGGVALAYEAKDGQVSYWPVTEPAV